MENDNADEQIKNALAEVKPHRLDSFTLKTKTLKFRLHDEEFEEIRETAEHLGLSISEYLCALHRYARPKLIPEPDAPTWVHPVHRRGRD